MPTLWRMRTLAVADAKGALQLRVASRAPKNLEYLAAPSLFVNYWSDASYGPQRHAIGLGFTEISASDATAAAAAKPVTETNYRLTRGDVPWKSGALRELRSWHHREYANAKSIVRCRAPRDHGFLGEIVPDGGESRDAHVG